MDRGADRARIVARAWRNGRVRRLAVAYGGFKFAEMAVWVGLAAYAYERGGVDEAAAIMVAQLLPAAAVGLLCGGLLARVGPTRLLTWGLAAQTGGMVLAAVAFASGAPVAWGYAGAILASTAVPTTRPSVALLSPAVVDGPDELTGANLLQAAVDGGCLLTGPIAAALLLEGPGIWAVFAAGAIATAAATLVVSPIRVPTSTGSVDIASPVRGAMTVARAHGPRVMIVALALHATLLGAIDVLNVIIAVELLGRPESFTGWLAAAFGFGALVAGGVGFWLVGRRWLWPTLLGGGVMVAVALGSVSLVGPRVGAVASLLALCGGAAAIYEVSSRMLLQRVARLDVLGHAFALVEGLYMAMIAAGAAVVPPIVDRLGPDDSPAGVAVVVLAGVALLSIPVIRIDRHARVPITEMAALRGTPLFAPLPAPALETLAREAIRVEVRRGEVVIRQGDEGDDYFAVVSGALEARVDDRRVGSFESGDGFGEIALLRAVTRTASVIAVSDAVLLRLGRQPFLAAVTNHSATAERADAITATRLGPPPDG